MVALTIRNYNFNQEARRKLIDFGVQELKHNKFTNSIFKIILPSSMLLF